MTMEQSIGAMLDSGATAVVDWNDTSQMEPPVALGSATVGEPLLRMYPPLEDEDQHMLHLLHRLDRLLLESSTVKKFDALIFELGEASGVRHIQGARVEVFCRASGKQSNAFDWLCTKLLKQDERERWERKDAARRRNCSYSVRASSRLGHGTIANTGNFDQGENVDTGNYESIDPTYRTPNEIKNAILDYAVKQARRDPRIGTSAIKRKYLFDNFSLIVNYHEVDAQPIHIDLQAPNHQFGMILTPNSPCTLEFRAKHKIRTVADVKQHVWPDLPDTLAHALTQQESAATLLREFGDLLCPAILPVSSSVDSGRELCTGTLMSLPGSVMHAGPSSVGFRAVLFFTAWPSDDCDNSDVGTEVVEQLDGSSSSNHRKTRVVPPYNPDTQYWTPLLTADTASSVWDAINNADRIYLLTKLADTVEKSQGKNVYCHLSDPCMQSFTKNIELKEYPKGQRDDFIAKFVAENGSELQPIGFGFFDNKGEFLEKLSVDNLVTIWDGKSFDIHVYRLNVKAGSNSTNGHDNRIAVSIYYPADSSWEGTVVDKPYFLTMTQPGVDKDNSPVQGGSTKTPGREAALFDGTNGVLQGCDGEEIPCSTRCKKRRADDHSESTVTPSDGKAG